MATVVMCDSPLDAGITFFGSKVIGDLQEFDNISRVILANHYDSILDDAKDKVYTRDISQ